MNGYVTLADGFEAFSRTNTMLVALGREAVTAAESAAGSSRPPRCPRWSRLAACDPLDDAVEPRGRLAGLRVEQRFSSTIRSAAPGAGRRTGEQQGERRR
jgi:hypothetical protein